MNILVATTNFPTRTTPHQGVFLERDVRGLAARGHNITCLVARSRLRARSRYEEQVERLKVSEGKYLSLSYVRGLEYLFGSLAQRNSTRTLRRLVKRDGDGAEVFYGKFLNTAPLLQHVPRGIARILGVGEGLDSFHNRLAFFRAGAMDRFLRWSDIIEVKNREVAEWMEERYPFAAERIRILPSGVDTDFFRPGDRRAARASLGIDEHAVVVASVGTRLPNKGGQRVIDACRSIRGRSVLPVLAGPGWEASATEGALGLGVVEPETVRTLLQAADVFVLASLSEGMPNAVLEALACGLPCLVADRPYNDFLVHERDCLKADPLSEPDLRDALELLIASPELRARLGEGGRETAARLSQASRVGRLEQLIQEAVQLRQRSR